MKRLVTRSLLGLVVVLLFASRASAALIPIGALYWDDTVGASKFSIVNQTGANYLGDPAFPVVTQLLFSGLSLAVQTSGGTTTIGQASMTSPDGGLSYDTGTIALNPYPQKASLTGSVTPTTNVALDLDGFGPGGTSLWNIGGTIVDALGNPIVVLGNGLSNISTDLIAVLYVDGTRQDLNPVPEPMTLTLVGTGLAGALLRRRRRAQQN